MKNKFNKIPYHVGIIMDGNGRWAQNKDFPRIYGHKEGMKTIENILDISSKIGINMLTLYAFSTENWKRPKKEVEYIFKLPILYKNKLIKCFKRNNIKVKWIGNKNRIDKETINLINYFKEKTKFNDGMIVNLAFNYGGRAEITYSIKNLFNDVLKNNISIEDINENMISTYLSTPDLDLLIRTGKEFRISNFLLWQSSYAEMIFMDKLWPDFTENDFISCVQEYNKRSIRKGAI